MGKRELRAEVHIPVTCQVVDLTPEAAIVAVGVVVIVDDVTDVSHVVGVVEIGLALVGLQVLGILINIIIVIAAEEVVDHLIIMCSGIVQCEAASHNEVGAELVFEEGGGASLLFVVMTFGEDIL